MKTLGLLGSCRSLAVSALLTTPEPAWAYHELWLAADFLEGSWLAPALFVGALAGALVVPWFHARGSGHARAYLLARGKGRWVKYPIVRDVTGIGRHRGNAICIADRSLSRYHAEIVRHADDTYTITDLGSKNGMRVRFHPAKTAPLKDADLIELGAVRFRFALAPVDEHILEDTQTMEAHRLWPERERRTSPRVAAHGHALLRGEDSTCVMGEIRDVSDGGLFVKSETPPAVHSPVQVAVEIEKGHWHTLPGEVVRLTGEGVGIHVSDPGKMEVLRRLRAPAAVPVHASDGDPCLAASK